MEKEGRTVADNFEELVSLQPHKAAIIHVNTGKRLTFSELDVGARQCASVCAAEWRARVSFSCVWFRNAAANDGGTV
jgi:hypothetical protein